MVDNDGYQQIRNRKNTRRNIFNEVYDDLRKIAYEQAVANKSEEALARQLGTESNRKPSQDGRLTVSKAEATTDLGSGQQSNSTEKAEATQLLQCCGRQEKKQGKRDLKVRKGVGDESEAKNGEIMLDRKSMHLRPKVGRSSWGRVSNQTRRRRGRAGAEL